MKERGDLIFLVYLVVMFAVLYVFSMENVCCCGRMPAMGMGFKTVIGGVYFPDLYDDMGCKELTSRLEIMPDSQGCSDSEVDKTSVACVPYKGEVFYFPVDLFVIFLLIGFVMFFYEKEKK